MTDNNPRQFLDEFVIPAVEEWKLEPLSVRKAVIAISQIDILADQVVVHRNPGADGDQLRDLQSNARKAEKDPTLRLIRDVHDTHKHGPLGRDSATIKTGARPKKKQIGGAFQAGAFQPNAFQVGKPALVIVQDNGDEHLVEDVITRAMTHWEAELAKLGL
jgi:hypothetical protein